MMWEFRYYETDSQGARPRKAVTVGSLAEYPTESAVRKSPAVQSLHSDGSTPKGRRTALGPEFWGRDRQIRKGGNARAILNKLIVQIATSKMHIRPRWADVPLNAVKAMAVEDWLKGLPSRPKRRATSEA